MKKYLTWIDAHSRLIVLVFFMVYFLLGIAVVRDYGISWDEPTERFTSLWHYKFAVSKLFSVVDYESPVIGEHMFNRQMLHGHVDRYYGTFLHWPLVAIEHATGFTMDSQEIFLARHINTFLYYFLAVVALYWLVVRRFKSWKVGLLGALFLILTPRFFAESFYNNKDILFASCYLISLAVALWFLDKKVWWRAVMLGVVLGITINTRVMGVLVLAMTVGWGLIDVIIGLKKRQLNNVIWPIISFVLVGGVAFATYIISMPTAWGNEIGFLPEVFKQFSQFNWTGKTLYLGDFAYWDAIPWHFIPVYMWATTPLWYSVLFVIGVVSIVLNTVKNAAKKTFWRSDLWRYDMFMLAAFLIPLLSVILLHSVVYDSWRHLYFIYGPAVYVMVLGIMSWKKQRRILLIITAIAFLTTAIWMIRNHPYQFMYFNGIARINAADNFERDYWGVVTMDMMRYLLANDERPVIKIWRHDYFVKTIDLFLNKEDKARFVLVEEREEADYRTHLFHNTKDMAWDEPGFEEIKSIEVDGIRVQSLYRKIPETKFKEK